MLPKYRYARGYPVVIGADLQYRLMGVEGDVDLVEFLGSHDEGVTEVWFDRLPQTRIETADDLPVRRRR